MGFIKELQEQFLFELGQQVASLGFKWKRKSWEFSQRARDTDVEHVLHVTFIRHRTDVDVKADVGLRHDGIERVFHDLMRDRCPPELRLTSRQEKESGTLGATLDNLGGKPVRWTLASPADIPAATAGVASTFRQVGLPYLDRLTTLEQIAAALADDGPNAWLYLPFRDIRASKAVIAAFLLGDRDRFDELVERKARLLQEKHDRGLGDFQVIAQGLTKRWKASLPTR